MGVCSISKTYKITPKTVPIDPISSCRSDLVSKLIWVNKLNVKYNQAIETCLLAEDESKAIIIKAKQIDLKDFQQLVQERIRKLDNSQEILKSAEKRLKLAKKIQQEVQEKYKELELIDDISQIMDKEAGKNYTSRLEKRLEVQDDDFKRLLQLKLQDQAKKIENLNKGSNYQRRRYVKSN
jgi:hypothetical protein